MRRSSILIIKALVVAFVLIGALEVRATTYPMNITITFPNGAPESAVNFVIITRDGWTNSTQEQWAQTTGNGVYSTTVSFTCISNLVKPTFEVRYVNNDADLVGGYSGSGAMNCDANPPPMGFVGPLTITSGTRTPLNAGSCEAKFPNAPKFVGDRVNVTNGNMFISQSDYVLPASVGRPVNVVRSYNSMIQANGLFGIGWTTEYEQTLARTGSMLRLRMPDGKMALFVNDSSNSSHYVSSSPAIKGQISRDLNNWDYTVTYQDGSKDKFDYFGKFLWRRDRNGNQTTLNYSGGTLISITDPFGRTLTFSRNAAQNVSAITDATGTIATYEYYTGTNKLKTVIYPDNSKYKFEYTTISNKVYLTTVKDALDNVLETHAYDSTGRATTSEVDGGVEKYTLDYTNTNLATDPHTDVTDALGRVTKYYFTRQNPTFMTTKTEGLCGCGGSGSEVTTYEYDTKLNLVKKTDSLSNETTYTYDSNSNLTGVTDSLGTQSFTYNTFGQVLTHTDRIGGRDGCFRWRGECCGCVWE